MERGSKLVGRREESKPRLKSKREEKIQRRKIGVQEEEQDAVAKKDIKTLGGGRD